jgi:hypothetical protein
MEYPTVEHVQSLTKFKTDTRAEGALEALKWLEAGAPHKLDGLEGNFSFDMSEFINTRPKCGTACCIAGAIFAFENRLDGNRLRPCLHASNLDTEFGISNDLRYHCDSELYRLFYAIGAHKELSSITPEEAAIVLRKYLETGLVDWSRCAYIWRPLQVD